LPDYQPIGKKSIGDDHKCDHNMLESNDGSLSGKDRNTTTEINLQSKFRANRFLRVHLRVLKALYEQETPTQSTSEDCHVEDKYWDVVENFLKDRNAIKISAKRTQLMRGIHDEAKEFQKNIPTFSIINNHIISHQVSPQFTRVGNRNNDPKAPRSNLTFGSSSLMLITQPSPHYLPNRPSRGWNGRGCKSGGRRNSKRNIDTFYDMQSETTEDDGGNAFGIVSGLLKRKHNLASRHLNQRTSKLRALVKESRSRIETLNSELIAEKDNEQSIFKISGKSIENVVTAKEECEDCQVRIETKIRLWKLLLNDLFGTISVQL